MTEIHVIKMYEGVIISAATGACMGSFLNVIAHRSIHGRKWWGNERSICEHCGHVLGACELIPVISFIIQRGKCKICGHKISCRYVFVEILCAILAMMIFMRWGISWACLVASLGTCGLIISSLTDIEAGEVFDAYAIFPGICGLIIRLAGGTSAILDGVYGILAGFGIFALIILLSRGGMGWGDATFMGGMGAVLGMRFTLLAFYLGIMTGGMCVIILLLLGKLHWGRGESIPLVPFLAIGCFMTLIFGPEIFAYLDDKLLYSDLFITSWPFR